MVEEGHVELQQVVNYPWGVVAKGEDNNRNQDLRSLCVSPTRKEEVAKSFRRRIDVPYHGQVEEEEQGDGEEELVEDNVHPEVILGVNQSLTRGQKVQSRREREI